MASQMKLWSFILRERLLAMLIFAALFTLIGTFLPKMYLTYLDKTEYVSVDTVAFNKKVYAPCEEVISTTRYYAKLDVEISLSFRTYRIIDENRTEPVQSFNDIKSFANKTPDGGRTIISTMNVPCDYKEGVYYNEGIIVYSVNGIRKTTPYRSTTVTIEATPSAEVTSGE